MGARARGVTAAGHHICLGLPPQKFSWCFWISFWLSGFFVGNFVIIWLLLF
jgi:hypothetical protein